jgi:hypothetical protein
MEQVTTSTTEDVEAIHAALFSAWREVFRQHLPPHASQIGPEEMHAILAPCCAMMGAVMGNIIANFTSDPKVISHAVETVRMNIPLGIEAVQRVAGPVTN